MAKINPDYQKNKIQLFTKSIDKGYIFKAKYRLSDETLNNIQKNLLEQLKSGIVIYPEETLELVDIYSFEIHEIVDSTEDKIIIWEFY